MHFEVPQFIEVEDKIFGPLTWRQFLYLGGGVGMAVVLFFVSKILFLIVGLPLAILAGALAFYPVNNRPFSFFLEAIFSYISKQRLYLWRQKETVVHKGSTAPADDPGYVTAGRPAPDATREKKDIGSLARKLELQAMQKTE